MGAIAYENKIYPAGSTAAKDSVFDNTGTNLEATNAEDAIKELNSNVIVIVPDSEKESGVTGTIRFVKRGPIVYLWLDIRVDLSANSFKPFCTVREEFRPAAAYYIQGNIIDDNDATVKFMAYDPSNYKLRIWSDTASTNHRLRGSITYMTV